MASFLRQRRPPPSPPADWDTYPLHFLDQATGYRFLLSWTMCSDQVLDASRLGASLSRLLEIGDWRKFAARLRVNKDGSLTAHVPRTFTDKQPAILFHHTSYPDTSIDNHPLKNVFLRPQKHQASTHEFDEANRAALFPPHFPKSFVELVEGDHPQISLHVIGFQDATILQLTWPHTMTDGPGYEALLRNWSLVMAGRESDVAPVLGSQDDVVCQLLQGCREESVVEQMKWGLADKIHALLRLLWRWLMRPRPSRKKMIYMPAPVYQHLLAAARKELAARPSSSPSARSSRVSNADILLAWCSKMVATASPKPRPVLALTIVNPRYRVPSLQEKAAGGVYVQNMSLPVYIQQTAAVVRSLTAGALAALNREQLQQQATEQQMLAFLKSVRRQSTSRGNIVYPICGDPASTLFAFNNLGPMELITAVDFSPAVVAAEGKAEEGGGDDGVASGVAGSGHGPDGKRSRGDGSLVSCACFFVDKQIDLAGFTAVGEDRAGGFWMLATLDAAQWRAVEAGLRALEEGDCGV
ncbi:hypothetical protein E4U41_002514 [Claviceps citrina]|nr:hypothetical protein E4U41_002514 [Claviceps citrina]